MLPRILGLILLSIPLVVSSPSIAHLKDIPEDGNLDFVGLALKYASGVEEHDVTTADGYVLKLHRIPGDKKKPVLVAHGLMGSSNEFLMLGNDSIAVSLQNAGYDVWLMNYRGNRYSRRHVSLNPDTDRAFWEFGAHEHATSDLATNIDFVLNTTGESQLSVIGHSEGTLITYILGSERPEYNDKIKIFLAMAPVCHLHYITKRLPFVIKFGYSVRSVVRRFKIEELGEHEGIRSTLARSFCAHTLVGMEVCRRVVFIASGYDSASLKAEQIPELLYHYPAGSSRKNLEHLLQMVVSKRFANYDYGPVKNMQIYGSKASPTYDLKRVTMRVYILASSNDRLSVPEDVRQQAKELPNLEKYDVVDDHIFNHIDFVWTRRSREIQPKLLQVLDKYN